MDKRGIAKRGIIAILLFTIVLSALFAIASTFLDDTDTNWNAGTLHNMKVMGTGAAANLSSSGNN